MNNNYFLSKLFTLGLGLSSIAAMSQTTIPADSANYIIGEDTKIKEIANANTFGAGTGGAAIVWDYSTLAAGVERDLKVMAPVTSGLTPDPIDAAVKLVVDRPLNDDEFFYNPSATGMGYAGQTYGITALSYEGESALAWEYPITYQDSKTVNVSNQYSSGIAQATIDHNIHGDVTYEVDAYGRIKMPYGDVYDVLRIKITENIIDTADVPIQGTQIYEYENVSYEWRTASNKHFILRFDVRKESSTTRTVFYQVGDSVNPGTQPTSTGLLIPEMPEFMVYPNPAKESISLSFDLQENEMVSNIQLTDMQGKLVKSFDASMFKIGLNLETYSLTDVPSGNYFMSMQSNQRSLQERIVIR